ncbi:hypothetical protein [Actinokineospora terrae]|uniref:Uncharacterized protein n=1 Tax=Actinokineospora terrae TaxID=155974 RepID=A0A1H9X1Y6_9PSEU|nr:hypothetical protein [Actinokineospora terrae]SES39663.1 hypothetical protein SAMN04487818_11297 [Actinokineospora terrae]
MYSLVSAPVLGFDLTRMVGGPATAEILLTLLSRTTADVEAIAERAAPPSPALSLARSHALAAASELPSVRDLSGPSAVTLLQHAPIGSLAGLLHCVRTDVLVPDRDTFPPGTAPEPPDGAIALVTDAVCATYLRQHLTDVDRRVLGAAWVAATRDLPEASPHLGPTHDLVHRLLARIRAAHPAEVRALAVSADRMRAEQQDWSAAMHSSAWAVHVAGRIREAAAAQLLLVRAVDLAGVTLDDRASGVWNVLSGAVQALMVRDLVDSASAQELLVPCLAAFGPDWLVQAD